MQAHSMEHKLQLAIIRFHYLNSLELQCAAPEIRTEVLACIKHQPLKIGLIDESSSSASQMRRSRQRQNLRCVFF